MESGAQIAGGVVIYPNGFQKKISKMCKKHNVLFILDEIATGFGRLGSMIEYQNQQSTPDIVSFGKMLSGGYLPLAATLASKKIYDSFLRRIQRYETFLPRTYFYWKSIGMCNSNYKYFIIQKIQSNIPD